jgi:hypothetical protein
VKHEKRLLNYAVILLRKLLAAMSDIWQKAGIKAVLWLNEGHTEQDIIAGLQVSNVQMMISTSELAFSIDRK